jgi:fructose-specific phosphotransferase system IIC component
MTQGNNIQTNSGIKSVAILGSSGGNLRSHGGNDPAQLISDVNRQLQAAGFELGDVQFVSASSSMDNVSPSTSAELWGLENGNPVVIKTGTLDEINKVARVSDERIAERVRRGEVTGLVLMSADPGDTNAKTIAAAAKLGIPAAGTGGSSVAKAQQMGVNMVAASGTTGTTSTTRAVSYVGGLARYWKVKYRPVLGGSSSSGGAPLNEAAWRRISIRGIMVGSIPAFIALALLLAISKIPGAEFVAPVFSALIAALPIIVAAVAAQRISGLNEVGLVAGAVAGILSQEGGILGGLVAGILAGLLASWLIKLTLGWRFPATTANIATGAFAGIIPGVLVFFVLAPVTSQLGEWVRLSIEWAVAVNPILAGALAGLAMWPAIIGGVYHSVILPLVLVEMAEKGHSFFGAIDMVALVMVSFGITLANVIRPRTSGERALAGSGAGVNFFFGTFVEAAYPFMFGDKKVFAIALISATAGGAVVGFTGAEASAYLPAVVAPFIATNVGGMVLAMLTSTIIALVLTLIVNFAAVRKARKEGLNAEVASA